MYDSNRADRSFHERRESMNTLLLCVVFLGTTVTVFLLLQREWILGSIVLFVGMIAVIDLIASSVVPDPRLKEFFAFAAVACGGLTVSLVSVVLLWRTWKRKYGLVAGALALAAMFAGDGVALYATSRQVPHLAYVLEAVRRGDLDQ